MHSDAALPPLERTARRGWLLAGIVAAVLVAIAALLTVSGQSSRPAPVSVGQTRTLPRDSVLFVQEGAYLLERKALDERDQRSLNWVFGTYEHLDAPAGTTVRVLQASNASVQVEIIGGPLSGRRGWLEPGLL